MGAISVELADQPVAVIGLASSEPVRVDLPSQQPSVTVTPVGHPGPQGVPGPPGPPGTAYEHSQGSASTIWTINHNLGYRPNVTLLTVGGVAFEGAITHTSNNQAVASFATPVAGSAICS
jgi:hypothetical protein